MKKISILVTIVLLVMVFGGISIPAAAISDNLVSAAASDFETSK